MDVGCWNYSCRPLCPFFFCIGGAIIFREEEEEEGEREVHTCESAPEIFSRAIRSNKSRWAREEKRGKEKIRGDHLAARSFEARPLLPFHGMKSLEESFFERSVIRGGERIVIFNLFGTVFYFEEGRRILFVDRNSKRKRKIDFNFLNFYEN